MGLGFGTFFVVRGFVDVFGVITDGRGDGAEIDFGLVTTVALGVDFVVFLGV